MKKKRYIIALAAILTAAVIIFFLASKGEHKPREGNLKTFTVKRGTIHQAIEATGEIKPCTGAEISLGARVTGMVVKEPIEIGDRVKKGDLIAIIDNRALSEDVAKARASLEKVRATYENAITEQQKEVARQKLLRLNAERELEAARQELSFARWDFKSQEALFSRSTHSTSEKAYRKSRAVLARSLAAFSQAKNSLKAAGLSVEKAQAELKKLQEEYTQALKVAQAELNKAEIRFSYSTLTAPFSGVISYVSTQEGETVVAGLNAPQFVKILDDTKIENRVYVDETEIGKIKEGMKVEFTVDAFVNETYRGVVTQIYPAPVIQNNVVYYIAVVTGFDNRPALRVRMTTHNQILTGIRKDVLVVPNSAVKFLDGRYVVTVKEGARRKTIPVEVGASDSRFTEIKSGIQEGRQVLFRQ